MSLEYRNERAKKIAELLGFNVNAELNSTIEIFGKTHYVFEIEDLFSRYDYLIPTLILITKGYKDIEITSDVFDRIVETIVSGRIIEYPMIISLAKMSYNHTNSSLIDSLQEIIINLFKQLEIIKKGQN